MSGYGWFSRHRVPRLGWNCGDGNVLDLAAAGVLGATSLNDFFAAGRREWDDAAIRITAAVEAGAEPRYPLAEVVLGLPFAVADLVRFDRHGRAGTVVLSGTGVRPPRGQLDVEASLGYVVGRGSTMGEPVSADLFREHVFGVVLVAGWIARDLEPLLATSFATSISAWVTPLELIDDTMTDVTLEIDTHVVAHGNAEMDGSQLVAHLTSAGASLRPGDLIATAPLASAAALDDGAEIVVRGRARAAELNEVRGRMLAAQTMQS